MKILGQQVPFTRNNAFNNRENQSRLRGNSNMGSRFMEATRSFGGWLAQLGIMFQGNRDIYTVYGYKKSLTYQHILGKYKRQDIASRIINAPADAVWSYPPTISGSPLISKALDDLTTRLSLWNILNRADKLSGMCPYSAILVGFDDGRPLSEPLEPNSSRKVTFLQPYTSENLHVSAYVLDPTNPRFGKPLTYNLRLQRDNIHGATTIPEQVDQSQRGTQGLGNFLVHYSRVVHITEYPLEDEVHGNPRGEMIYNLLDDLLKIGGGSAEIYWLQARGGLHINVDKDMDLAPADEDSLADEIDDYTNNQRRVIRTRGVDVKPINMQTIDPRQAFEVTMSLIAAATGIPQRLLMGTEAGQLASEQDRANWATFIEERRANFAEPSMLRPLLNVLAYAGLFDAKEILKITCTWPEAFHLSPLERAQTSAQQARSAANLVKCLGTPDTPATEPTTDPATGSMTPGQPGKPGTPALLSVEEARGIIANGYDVPFKNSKGLPKVAKAPTAPKSTTTTTKTTTKTPTDKTTNTKLD